MFDSNEDDLYLFMEYASEGDLTVLIEEAKLKKKRISETLIWNILLQLSEGTLLLIQDCSTYIKTTSSTAISNPLTSSKLVTGSTNSEI
jgi:serine/threonine protein kinase